MRDACPQEMQTLKRRRDGNESPSGASGLESSTDTPHSEPGEREKAGETEGCGRLLG